MQSEHSPLVSAIVTTRNSHRTLEACLRSLRTQTHPHLEVLVIDNASTDGTADIAARWADEVADMGPERSAQRNHGARIARGEFLLFIDSDMVLARDVVADCVRQQAITGAPAVVIPETSVGRTFWARCKALERSCYDGDDTVEAARFYTQESFWSARGFDESLLGPEDWDLSRRVAAGTSHPRTRARIIHDEGPLAFRTIVSKKRYYARGYMRYLRKHGASTLPQGNLLLRTAFLRHRRRLLDHPVLTTGVIVLKSAELVGTAIGVLETRLPPQRRPTIGKPGAA